jgi:hypothetical protein
MPELLGEALFDAVSLHGAFSASVHAVSSLGFIPALSLSESVQPVNVLYIRVSDYRCSHHRPDIFSIAPGGIPLIVAGICVIPDGTSGSSD